MSADSVLSMLILQHLLDPSIVEVMAVKYILERRALFIYFPEIKILQSFLAMRMVTSSMISQLLTAKYIILEHWRNRYSTADRYRQQWKNLTRRD